MASIRLVSLPYLEFLLEREVQVGVRHKNDSVPDPTLGGWCYKPQINLSRE